MVEKRGETGIKKSAEKCPDCGAEVIIKFAGGGHSMELHNLDDTLHRCGNAGQYFEPHAIGRTVVGKKVTDYQLRGRVLSITLDDGNVLSVTAPGRPLNIQLAGPAGVCQE